MLKTEIDSGWQDWVATNLDRGFSRQQICGILMENGFSKELAEQAVGISQSYKLLSPLPQASRQLTEAGLYLPHAIHVANEKVELYIIPKFLSDAECMHLITLTNNDIEQKSTNKICNLERLNDSIANDINRRICEVMGVSPKWSEPLQTQRFDEGESSKQHTDYFGPHAESDTEFDVEKGQRTWTFMVSLNRTQQGGATRFINLNAEFKPKQGDAIIWRNLHASGLANPDTMHCEMAVEKGFKVLLTKWFRDRGEGNEITRTPGEYLPPLTTTGFVKTQAPADLCKKLLTFYHNHSKTNSENNADNNSANTKENTEQVLPFNIIGLDDSLQTLVQTTLTPYIEAWMGDFVTPTEVKGLYRYNHGAKLKMQRSCEKTQQLSVIINLEQKTEQPWPLVIQDHFARQHELLLRPGQMILLESARLLHGSPTRFNGEHSLNIVAHFKLKNNALYQTNNG